LFPWLKKAWQSSKELTGEEIDDLIYKPILDQVIKQALKSNGKKESSKSQDWKGQIAKVMESESVSELKSLLGPIQKRSHEEKGERTVLDHQTTTNILYQLIVERIKKLERAGLSKLAEGKTTSCGDDSKELQKALEDVQKLEEKVVCTLCAEHEKDTALKPCNHIFCNQCVRQLRKSEQSCPVCRAEISSQEKVYL